MSKVVICYGRFEITTEKGEDGHRALVNHPELKRPYFTDYYKDPTKAVEAAKRALADLTNELTRR
jgi:hypothetical protein